MHLQTAMRIPRERPEDGQDTGASKASNAGCYTVLGVQIQPQHWFQARNDDTLVRAEMLARLAARATVRLAITCSDEEVTEKPMKKHIKASSTSTRNVVLGLLAQRPMSGYDIRRLLGGLSWLVGSPSFGALYPGLHTLLADGLATVEAAPSEKGPLRKIYSITEAGREALQDWASQRVQPGGSLKGFVMRLVLASNLSSSSLYDYLQQRLEQVASFRPRIEEARGATTEEIDLGQYLTLDYSLALADAELAWLDRTLARLSKRGSPKKVDT